MDGELKIKFINNLIKLTSQDTRSIALKDIKTLISDNSTYKNLRLFIQCI